MWCEAGGKSSPSDTSLICNGVSSIITEYKNIHTTFRKPTVFFLGGFTRIQKQLAFEV